MKVVRDHTGKEFSGEYLRIVSLVPSLTKTIFDIGGSDRVVGVTRFCVLPEEAKRKVDVGGTKNFSVEKIRSLEPDLIVVNVDENPRGRVGELMRDFPVFVTHPQTVEDNYKLIADLADLLGLSGGEEAQYYLQGLGRVLKKRRPMTGKRVFCPIWKKPWMSFNGETYLNSVLEFLGLQNACAGEVTRYPVVDLNLLGQVDCVLLPSEPWRFSEKDAEELKKEEAFRDSTMLLVDGTFLSWYGTQAVEGLSRLLELTQDILEPGGTQT